MVVPATAIVTPGRRTRMSLRSAGYEILHHPDRHTPRKRGIQYVAAFRFRHIRSGIPGRPLSRAITAGYASAIPRWTQGRGECRMPDAPAARVQKKCTRQSPQVHRNHPPGPLRNVPVICADCEAVYFCGQDWTASIRLIQLCKFGPARTPRASLSMPAASVVGCLRPEGITCNSHQIRCACSANDRNRLSPSGGKVSQ